MQSLDYSTDKHGVEHSFVLKMKMRPIFTTQETCYYIKEDNKFWACIHLEVSLCSCSLVYEFSIQLKTIYYAQDL